MLILGIFHMHGIKFTWLSKGCDMMKNTTMTRKYEVVLPGMSGDCLEPF